MDNLTPRTHMPKHSGLPVWLVGCFAQLAQPILCGQTKPIDTLPLPAPWRSAWTANVFLHTISTLRLLPNAGAALCERLDGINNVKTMLEKVVFDRLYAQKPRWETHTNTPSPIPVHVHSITPVPAIRLPKPLGKQAAASKFGLTFAVDVIVTWANASDIAWSLGQQKAAHFFQRWTPFMYLPYTFTL